MSDYYMGLEIQQTYVGMMIALPPAMWKRFAGLTADQWANVLRDAAAQVQPTRYRKARRGPKKKPTRKAHYQNGGHVSTHKLIQKRQK